MRRSAHFLILVLLSVLWGSLSQGSPPEAQAAFRQDERVPNDDAIDKWGLWTNGPHLRGVDLHACHLTAENGCASAMTRQDLLELRDLGANLVNASYPGVFTEQPPYTVNPNALANLDNLIAWAQDVGLYVVVHFRTGPGRNEAAITLDDDPLLDVWLDQAAHDGWIEMWRFTVDRYRQSPIVVGYNLMVEPHPNTLIDSDWDMEPSEVQTLAEGTLTDWNAFAVEITAAIRAVDPNTPIIVNNINWASAEWFSVLRPTGDPRTVYSLDAYDPDVYVDQEPGATGISYPDIVEDYLGESIALDSNWLEENYRPVREFAQEHNVPIYVGEFGVVRWAPGAADFLRDQTNLFERFGWNYAAYLWRGDESEFDGFNLEYGSDPDNHATTPDNSLLDVLRDRWAHNTDSPGTGGLGGNSGLRRDFTFTLPLFAPNSTWNQVATVATVLPDSDQQILATYRVLRGDISTLHGYEEAATTWPFMDISLDDWTIPIFRAGTEYQEVLVCDYDGQRWTPPPKFGIDTVGGPVTVPAPAGPVRPSGPEGTEADGHLVIYDPAAFIAYDYIGATTQRDGEGQSWGAGVTGPRVLQSHVIDFFDVRGAGVSPDTDSSARAHGTPLLAGLILPEDIESGVIAHALAFSIPGPRNTSPDREEPLRSDYFYPASTTETDFFNTNPHALAAGQRIRLKQALIDEEGEPLDESLLAPTTRMYLQALRTYGAYLVDNAGGFTLYAEDSHTAVLHLSDDEINTLIGQPPGTPLAPGLTKWQIVIGCLADELMRIPIADGPWEEGQDPATAMIEVSNFEVIASATVP